jgi:hypothetical protein
MGRDHARPGALMAGTNVALAGSAGTRDGFELKVYIDRDRNTIIGDPRNRLGADVMASLNSVQRDELIDTLIAARTAKLPPLLARRMGVRSR